MEFGDTASPGKALFDYCKRSPRESAGHGTIAAPELKQFDCKLFLVAWELQGLQRYLERQLRRMQLYHHSSRTFSI